MCAPKILPFIALERKVVLLVSTVCYLCCGHKLLKRNCFSQLESFNKALIKSNSSLCSLSVARIYCT